MGPASLQEEREPERESTGEMEGYRCLLQAGSQLESTLQQVTVPVSLKEVGGYIEKQVAYLTGGRGEDSSVIITLPESSAFSDIPEEALAKVFTYLTLIPRTRQPGVKFIIILDRRLDTWASIKTALARIAPLCVYESLSKVLQHLDSTHHRVIMYSLRSLWLLGSVSTSLWCLV
ncbi:Guanine nucleotide exchange factor DBS [Liparis tanakae]|uniref:Guanine nucleotide exchange factor DBS n=1 Tax=Liparis tanakae TaxID=230148 RepID=A0A4Z2HU95_9TELE|nr:Guanine nucleotide exchange factor DBS [Liparis tanakae]